MALKNNTLISSKVVEILQEADALLSVPQITEKLNEENLTPNKTTLYRILSKLSEQDSVTTVTPKSGTTYFEWAEEKKHHHHFFCNNCNTAYCLETCHVHTFDINLSTLLPNKNFKINTHDFNLYGVCEPCLKR